MSANSRIKEITDKLKNKRLYWLGSRGIDGLCLKKIPQFNGAFSVISAMKLGDDLCDFVLENLSLHRYNLDIYSPDQDPSPSIKEFSRIIYNEVRKSNCAVIPYRPWNFFSSVYLTLLDSLNYLGLLPEAQAQFEYKPWVELQLSKWKIKTIPWIYVNKKDISRAVSLLKKGPIVLRLMQSAGGTGMQLIRSIDEFYEYLPEYQENTFCVSPYLFPNIPINFGGCVFENGVASLHTPSIQLIGIEGLTSKKFGYCGNDFAGVRDLDSQIITSIEKVMARIGKLLSSKGYLGSFGVDAIIHNGQVFVTEINPRFQGSSYLSSVLDAEMGLSNIYYEHLAAFLGLQPIKRPNLLSLVSEQPKYSQIVAHNITENCIYVKQENGINHERFPLMLFPDENIKIDKEAIIFRLVVNDSVTNDGTYLVEKYREDIQHLKNRIATKAAI